MKLICVHILNCFPFCIYFLNRLVSWSLLCPSSPKKRKGRWKGWFSAWASWLRCVHWLYSPVLSGRRSWSNRQSWMKNVTEIDFEKAFSRVWRLESCSAPSTWCEEHVSGLCRTVKGRWYKLCDSHRLKASCFSAWKYQIKQSLEIACYSFSPNW